MPAQSRKDQLKEESGSYVPKLVACFYAVFDPTLGPRVVYQIPEGSVATALSTFPSRTESPADSPASPPPHPVHDHPSGPTTGTTEPIIRSTPVLFDFSSVIDFVIPKPELCGHLITKATRTSKILGLPTRIVDEEKYHHSKQVYNRNSFIFNLCFVFERDAELSVYEPVAWKVGRILGQLEETHSLLSNPPAQFSMANLLEQMYLDLNAYSETSITLLDTDLSLFLLPFYANPPQVKLWDVPIAVADLESMKSYSWDVTLFKICSFINGVNHVRKIAELAEVDLYLARMSIQHLVYYNAVILVDLFQFTNSYTALPDIAEVAHSVNDDDDEGTDVRLECEKYVFSGERDSPPVPFSTLLSYYSQLRPGLTVSSWIDDLSLDSEPIDVRRMIQFGVIKGFLRRVYAYPVWLDHPSLHSSVPTTSASNQADHHESGQSKRTTTVDRKSINPVTLKLVTNLDERGRIATTTTSVGSGTTTNSTAVRPEFARANSSQMKMLHSPHSETSTRSAPAKLSPPLPRNTTTTTTSELNSRRSIRTDLENSSRTGSPLGSPRTRATTPNENPDPDETTTKTNMPAPVYPTSLTLMLDGNHHTDEICLKYGIGWRTLEAVLKHLGGERLEVSGGSNTMRVEERRSSITQSGSDKGFYGNKVVMLWV
ncbi:nitrogen permease regulating protein NPR2 [Sporobolomyces koalae]|uniref:nitrogen permease regulating protein NPR2 n=1 Tax=Sporobolomyces koalae TaxID=500713 RepID=UPI003181A4FE